MVMGVLNVTPDSFFDGGRYRSSSDAVAQGRAMFSDGADMVDVGGESSRPGAAPVDEDEELRRVIAVIEALAPIGPVSVDTVKPGVARAAVAAGALLINDVSGTLWPVAAECGVGWVAMHRQGTPADMQADPRYDDVVAEVHRHVLDLAERAGAAGVGEIWLDPGSGSARPSPTTWPSWPTSVSLVGGAEAIGGPGPRRDVEQVVPRADRVGGRAPPAPRAGRGVAGVEHLGHGGGCSHGAGPRRVGKRPGRPAGRTGSPA